MPGKRLPSGEQGQAWSTKPSVGFWHVCCTEKTMSRGLKRERTERKKRKMLCISTSVPGVTFSAQNLHSSWTNSIQEDTIAAPDTYVQSDDLLNPHSKRC